MATEIKTWQIIDGKLETINTSMSQEGRTEPYDLEEWIVSNPSIIGSDLVIVGRQVSTKSGSMDLLAIDKSGNLVIIELKRDKLPREALAQAIDYASDVAYWSIEKLSEICTKFKGKSLEDSLSETFQDIDLESLNVNESQRIILAGFSIESSLERMIEWLSDKYDVNINAVILKYVKTRSGDELLTKTAIISEELELEKIKKKKKFEIPMSDEPGNYDDDKLKQLLVDYLSRDQITIQRIRNILIPACLEKGVVTREQLKNAISKNDVSVEGSKVGYYLTVISSQLGMKKNDFLRQVIKYEYPNNPWEKDNYQIRENRQGFIKEVLQNLNNG